MNNHWSDYWEQGHLTSFGESFTSNYTGVLNDIWTPRFAELTSDFKVLDIATGNGALPLMMSDYLKNRSVEGEVIGVDLANIKTDISSVKLAENLNIKLLSNIDCIKLPFEDGQFELVISQFGIEYANLKKAVPEALRVLRTKGRLALVMHHKNSLILRRNRRILSLIKSDEIEDIFNLLSGIVDKMGEVKSKQDLDRAKQDQSCEALRKQLNTSIGILAERDEEALKDCELLNYVATLFQTGLFWKMDKKQNYIEFARQQLKTLYVRLSELADAAQSESSLAEIINLISLHDASLDHLSSVIDENRDVLGWNLLITKQ
ncbi:class I SAM-dependent methyltransferase [Shewanella atlantica]|uniref:Class I SAM-dependent methyltransferase n=1 Tax=Shewanella atlantica TaxID=271099 RepID=A0A431WFF1_9GAMM|nr:class I SAM-dependent methyltransferase [Shewanella atlantica]RTR34314.1 class I SAM-dependent methyltransferase [Shewanella atlantica]